MTFRVDNDIEFYATATGGTGNLAVGDPVSSIRRTPADVMEVGDVFPLKIEEEGKSETVFCTLVSSTEVARTRVIDRWDRTAPITAPIGSISLSKVEFSGGQLYAACTLPQPMNIFLQEDGTFAYSSAVRATMFYALIENIQDPSSDLLDNQAVVAISGLVAGDELGGVFLYDAAAGGAADGVDTFAAGTVGDPRPGLLIRQRMSIAAAFFTTDLSIYAVTGVSRLKLHRLGKADGGSADAWMGLKLSTTGAQTDMQVIARDRKSAERAMMKFSAFATDTLDFAEMNVPLKPSAEAAALANIPSGAEARFATDARIWLNDAARGLVKRIYAETEIYRAIVDDLADVLALTPDNWEDNERALVLGRDSPGDCDPFWYKWLSGSASTHDGSTVIKPTLHIGGGSWTENGRFILGKALTTATVDTAGASGYEIDAFKRPVIIIDGGGSIDDVVVAENETVLLIRGDADVTINHDAAKINLGGANIALTATYPRMLLYGRNGVSFLAGAAPRRHDVQVGDGSDTVDVDIVSDAASALVFLNGAPVYPSQITSVTANSPTSGQTRIVFSFTLAASDTVLVYG